MLVEAMNFTLRQCMCQEVFSQHEWRALNDGCTWGPLESFDFVFSLRLLTHTQLAQALGLAMSYSVMRADK